MVTVRDIRRHLPLPDGKSVSDWQIYCFLMMYRAMKDAEAEKMDRETYADTDSDVMDNQS